MVTRGVPKSLPSQAFSVRRADRSIALGVLALGAALCLGGCGHTIYAINANTASAKL